MHPVAWSALLVVAGAALGLTAVDEWPFSTKDNRSRLWTGVVPTGVTVACALVAWWVASAASAFGAPAAAAIASLLVGLIATMFVGSTLGLFATSAAAWLLVTSAVAFVVQAVGIGPAAWIGSSIATSTAWVYWTLLMSVLGK
jgi:hypothetical protein